MCRLGIAVPPWLAQPTSPDRDPDEIQNWMVRTLCQVLVAQIRPIFNLSKITAILLVGFFLAKTECRELLTQLHLTVDCTVIRWAYEQASINGFVLVSIAQVSNSSIGYSSQITRMTVCACRGYRGSTRTIGREAAMACLLNGVIICSESTIHVGWSQIHYHVSNYTESSQRQFFWVRPNHKMSLIAYLIACFPRVKIQL